ncbi:hypothetical protein IBE10_04070 [Francisella tularensis subsp. novicida]|uniref:Wzz/FepE/Etk N-terminal domain-containing protein n=1 Tax=Francisella tularensis TaxID=263 RepID=UPI0008FCF361|nr:Wzz/FepE/Etk N-terminal domain-containing protein [Francisella tularensis]APC94732.1 hypothetical protein KX02_1464 [Francisella tularensis subsp. novicida]MBK2346103.1 hypothetical protein [Francisella tularensis subsp. novicida]
MAEIKNDEYIEISLTKILVGLFSNIKTFLVVLVLGCCLTAVAAWLFKPSYSYLQMIQPPYYLKGYSANSIISDNKLNVILNNILQDAQQSQPDNKILNNIDIIKPGDDVDVKSNKDEKAIYFGLSTSAKLSDKGAIDSVFSDVMERFSNSNIVQRQIKLWKDNLQRTILANQQNIDRYKQIIKSDQDYVKQLSSSKNVGSLQGQTLLASYMERIDSYQNKVFSLEDSQSDLKLTLESLQPKVVGIGDINYVKNTKLSRVNLVVIGLVLSVVIALVVVFLKVIFSRAITEYRNLKQ